MEVVAVMAVVYFLQFDFVCIYSGVSGQNVLKAKEQERVCRGNYSQTNFPLERIKCLSPLHRLHH